VSTFPEFVPPFVAVAGLGIGLLLLERGLRRLSWSRSRAIAARLLVIGVGIVLAAPIGVNRMVGYLTDLQGDSPIFASLPLRHLTAENGGAWAFGFLHIYQLPRFDILSEPKTLVAIGLPIALALVLVLGVARAGARRALFVVAPIAVAILFGLVTYRRYQGGQCEYCMWKSLTFMLPFLGVGVALGVQELGRLVKPRRSTRFVIGAAAAAIVLAATAAVANADGDLVDAEKESAGFVPPGLRELRDVAPALPESPSILIEGADATAAPVFTLPAVYYLASRLDRPRISVLPLGVSGAYLGMGADPGARFYDPDYEYVLTTFGGLRTDRTLLVQSGSVSLLRRAPVDVSPARLNYGLDLSEGPRAIPWITDPFELWVSAPRTAPETAVSLVLTRPLGDQATLFFRLGETPLGAARSADGSRLCVEVPLESGQAVVTAEPQFDKLPPAAVRATENDPVPPPLKAIGLVELRGDLQGCPMLPPPAVPTLRFRDGFYTAEPGLEGSAFRWMRTRGTLDVGEVGMDRPPAEITAAVTSLAQPRQLTVSVDGQVINSFDVPPNFEFGELKVIIPGGTGVATVELDTAPGEQPAADVNPADPRSMAIGITRVGVRPAP
jgi:hypothetical protein